MNIFRPGTWKATKSKEMEGTASGPVGASTRTPLRRPETPTASNALGSVRDEIERRAYFKWHAAGCPEGDSDRFWLEAEAEVLAGR